MATILDRYVSIGPESTFGTYAAPTVTLEILDGETSAEHKPGIVQGEGLRNGYITPRSNRRVKVTDEVSGAIGVELLSKGLGKLLNYCFGGGQSTLVSGTTYQQVHQFGGPPLPSFVVQDCEDKIAADGSTTLVPKTYLGCTVDSFEFELNQAIAKLTANWDGRAMDTGQSAVATALPSGGNLFNFSGLVAGTGAFTAPTATALGIVATPMTNLISAKVQVANNITTNRRTAGNAGLKSRHPVGARIPTGEFVVEYTDETWRDAYNAQTVLSWGATYSGGALSSGSEALQILIPALMVDSIKRGRQDGVPILTVGWSGMVDPTGSNAAMYVVTRTSDAAF